MAEAGEEAPITNEISIQGDVLEVGSIHTTLDQAGGLGAVHGGSVGDYSSYFFFV